MDTHKSYSESQSVDQRSFLSRNVHKAQHWPSLEENVTLDRNALSKRDSTQNIDLPQKNIVAREDTIIYLEQQPFQLMFTRRTPSPTNCWRNSQVYTPCWRNFVSFWSWSKNSSRLMFGLQAASSQQPGPYRSLWQKWRQPSSTDLDGDEIDHLQPTKFR